MIFTSVPKRCLQEPIGSDCTTAPLTLIILTSVTSIGKPRTPMELLRATNLNLMVSIQFGGLISPSTPFSCIAIRSPFPGPYGCWGLAFWASWAGGGSVRVNQPFLLATNQGRVSHGPAFFISPNRGYLATLSTCRLSGKNPRYDSNIRPGVGLANSEWGMVVRICEPREWYLQNLQK
jgi:hypothetical protein